MGHKLLRAVLFGICVVLLVLLFGEFGARLLQLDPASLITLDSCTGYKSIPNSHGMSAGPGGLIPISINSAGFRDVEHPLQKNAGVYRVLFLGDSMTEALQVPEEETFVRQLQAMADSKHLSLEFINMGVSSFDTAQEVLTYECYGRAYHPDLVVLDFNGGNVLNNYFRTDQFTPSFNDTNGQLVLDESYKTNIATRIKQRDTLYPGILYYIKDHSMLLRYLLFKMGNAQAEATLAANGASDLSEYITPYPPKWEAAWTLTQAIIYRLRTDTQMDGAKMLIVNFPTLEQMGPQNTNGLYNYNLPDTRIMEIGSNLQIPVLDLYPALLSAQKTAPVHWQGDPHLTAFGHTTVAGILLNEVLYLRNK